jgi:hypothetical protein
VKSPNTILVGAVLAAASLASGATGLFLISRSAYRRARLEAILDEPARIFDSSLVLQGGALLVFLLGLVGLAMIGFGLRDRRGR